MLAAATVLAVAGGCFEFDLEGDVRSSGHFSGEAHLLIPARVLKDDELGPMVAGSGGSVVETWRRRGVRVESVPDERHLYRVRAGSVTSLTLPWLAIRWERGEGGFTYAHRVTPPAAVLASLESAFAKVLRPLAGQRIPAPKAMAHRMLSSAGLEVELRFPGPVTATNGERVDERTVRWRYGAEALRSSAELQGRARGRAGTWAEIRDWLLGLMGR